MAGLVHYGDSDLESDSEDHKVSSAGLVSYPEADPYRDDTFNSDEIEDINKEDQKDEIIIEEKEGEEEKEEIEDETQNYEMEIDESIKVDALSQSVRNLAADDVHLPPEPEGNCSKTLQEYIANKLSEGKDFNESIQKKKNFRNPSIYEKLISYLGIDEYGSNYPPDVFDPHGLGEESYYDNLSRAQKLDMEKRMKDKKERTKVEFMSGTKKTGVQPIIPATQDDQARKRKSKWDVGSNATVAAAAAASAPSVTSTNTVPIAATVIPAATGSKSTIIPAVGAIKKPKI